MDFLVKLMENNPVLFIILCCVVIVLAVGIVLFVLLRRVHIPEKLPTGAISCPEDLIGKTGLVVETVDTDAGTGLVEIDGNGWSARTVYADETYEIGKRVSVVAIEGVKVIVRADS